MKAAVYYHYGKPDVIKIKEVDTPKPGTNEVLIKMHAFSVNPVDWKVVKGKLRMITGNKFPKFIGIEGSGIIEEAGNDVKDFKKGQRVFVGLDYHGGACAEYVCTGIDKILLLIDGISYEEASTMAVAGMTALQAFRDKGNIKPGMDVLINGASGGVGTYAVQIAKIFGANVTAVCSEKNFDLVKSLGADKVIDYHREDFSKNRNSYDIVLDAVGYRSFWQVRKALKKKGVYINISPSLALYLSSLFTRISPGKKSKAFMLNPAKEDLKEIMNLITSKKIKVVFDKFFPFEETSKAFEYSSTERAKGKIVISINKNDAGI